MQRRHAALVLQLAALVGLVVSALLVVQYAVPHAGLCGPGGGCHAVQMCRFAHVAGVSWPVIGVLAFGSVLALSLSGSSLARRWLPVAGAVAGTTGATLIVLQKVACGAFCPYCLVTDTAAIGVALAAWWGRREEAVVSPRRRWTFGGLALAAVLGAFGWGFAQSQPVPPPQPVAELPSPIAAEQRPGVATIVEFADFECPYCRRQHQVLSDVLASYGARVRFVRKHVPLSRIHPHAEHAARAACCAEEQGRGEPMADALFHAEDISPAGCETIAARLGLNMQDFRACLNAPRVAARLERDRDAATHSEVRGLPTMFVGHERFEGVVPEAQLRASIDRALRQTASTSTRPQG